MHVCSGVSLDCVPSGSSNHGILQQEYWSGLPFPPSGRMFPTQALNPRLLHCRQILDLLSHSESLGANILL